MWSLLPEEGPVGQGQGRSASCRFDVCDGSQLMSEFMALQSGSPEYEPRKSLELPKGLVSAAQDKRAIKQPVDLQALLQSFAANQSGAQTAVRK